MGFHPRPRWLMNSLFLWFYPMCWGLKTYTWAQLGDGYGNGYILTMVNKMVNSQTLG